MHTLGTLGACLIKSFETLALVAYRKFPHEPWTAGWGHTGPDVTQGTTCTAAQADIWFTADTARAVAAVNRLVFVELNQNQFDALVSFTYNLGVAALAHSTLLERINDERWRLASVEFLRWDHVGPDEVEGLKKRRTAEAALFILKENS
jgi:lysozyme